MLADTTERRHWLRFDKVFPVLIESSLYGYMNCIARNISCGGLFLETRSPLPLGSELKIFFAFPEGAPGISAVGQVKNHYYLNFGTPDGPASVTGMGVRFTQFDGQGEEILSQSVKMVCTIH
jgi:hypothetical protein